MDPDLDSAFSSNEINTLLRPAVSIAENWGEIHYWQREDLEGAEWRLTVTCESYLPVLGFYGGTLRAGRPGGRTAVAADASPSSTPTRTPAE